MPRKRIRRGSETKYQLEIYQILSRMILQAY